MSWNSGPCLSPSEEPTPNDGVAAPIPFGTRFDSQAGGTFWWVDLGDNQGASGYADTASEALQVIADYQRAQTSVLRFRGPRSVYGGDG